MDMTLATSVDKGRPARLRASVLKRLLDPASKAILNAENLAVRDDGRRLFVTGTENVFEIKPKGEHDWIMGAEIALAHPQGTALFRNGLASDGRYLYLACAYIDQDAHPLVGRWFPPLTKTAQDVFGATLLFLAETIFDVTSWVMRADLERQPPLVFEEPVQLTGKCFANGLAVDRKRGHVYVANSLPGANSGIHRLSTEDWPHPAAGENTLWCPTGGAAVPNGIKILDDTLLFTQIRLLPLLSSTIVGISLRDGPSEPREKFSPELGVLFDDFDATNAGFAVAAITDFTNVAGGGTGALFFYDRTGARCATFRDSQLKHPSAVVEVRKKANDLEPGDLLVTEKESHTLWQLRLTDEHS